jgi:pyrroline-5-carboxylate reductase
MTQLQIIGGGKMGEALLGGLVDRGWAAADIAVVEALPARREELLSTWPALEVRETPLEHVDSVIAVKPAGADEVARALGSTGVRRILSIAAGVTLARLEAAAGDGVAVVRAMPNTPALVGLGAAAIAAGHAAGPDDVAWARSLLEAVGLVVEVAEADLDAVTGVSGSGPAYLFLLAEAMIDAGIAQGLTPEVATVLTEQTLVGAATLLRSSPRTPAALRADVTSPNGTTAAGIGVFEASDFRGLVAAVVAAATHRSRELGAS